MNDSNFLKRAGLAEQVRGEDRRKRYFLAPTRVVRTWGDVSDAESLLTRTKTQATINPDDPPCVLRTTAGMPNAAILIDFGRELHGTVRVTVSTVKRIGTDKNIPFRARVRFGESISEATTAVGGSKNATNDHAIRDGVMNFTFMSMQETGETGFRYLWFEVLDPDLEVKLESLTAVLILEEYPWLGSFACDDERLNRIWNTAMMTVQLNTQGYFWDGIKRDRIVWLGDMNTEVAAALRVYGDAEVVRKSLDYAVRTTPLPGWMNGIITYSFWWLINLYELYLYTGDADYIRKHGAYIVGLVEQFLPLIRADGTVNTKVARDLVDWSTRSDEEATYAGFVGLFGFCLQRVTTLLEVLQKPDLIEKCKEKYALLKSNPPKLHVSKVADALLALGGIYDAKAVDANYIEPGGAAGYSTFMGYSILNAKALAGNIPGAIRDIRDYWGAMLDLGATSFWEDFDMDWIENSTGINEFPTEGKNDVHGDFGKHCYIGLRHSLCHGWAAGPCPWLLDNVLGVHILKPGMKEIEIRPELGTLGEVHGSLPTPYGILRVSHQKDGNGTIFTTIDAPAEVKITLVGCRAAEQEEIK